MTQLEFSKSISMFEAVKDNHCNEYRPWNYDLLGGDSVNKILDDDEQDLRNSMVDDLVAKILDDDCITGNDIFTNHYNDTVQQHEVGAPISLDCKTRLGKNAYLTNTNDVHMTYPEVQVENNALNINGNDQEYKNISTGLNSLNFNLCLEEQNYDKTTLYTNGHINNVERTIHISDNSVQKSGQQYHAQVINNESFSSMQNSYTPLSNNGLITTTSNLNYNPHSANWSDTLFNDECVKGLFGHYSQLQSCNNIDYDLNVALNLSLNSEDNTFNEMQLCCKIPQNSHNDILNIHDSCNVPANSLGYSSSSIVTDLTADSGFVSNASSQHFSPINYYSNNLQQSTCEEYKNYHEMSNLIVNNIAISSEQLYLKQQNSRTCKLDDTVSLATEHLDKGVVNPLNLTESQQFVLNNDSHRNSAISHDQRLNTLIKMLSSKGNNDVNSKLHEQQVFSPVGYSHNLATAAVATQEYKQLQQLKFNCQTANDCQHLMINDADALKFMQQHNSQINHKRSSNILNTYKMTTGYDLSNSMNFSSSNFMSQQHLVTNNNNSIDNEFFNHLLKQRQQQQHIKNVPTISSNTDIFFNAGLIQSTNTNVFSNHAVMPLPVTVPSSISIFESGLGYRNSNSTRRSGPSRILYSRLEQTYEQFKQLEKERKKCEAGLAAHFPGKKVTSANNISIPRLQGSPSRVDKLIIDHFREHARVITLITKMERLRAAEMNQRIHNAVDHWRDAIKFVQERRKQEITNTNKRQKENLHGISIHDDNAFPDIQALAESIYKLTEASRFARTAMFNAMQATLLYDSEVENKIVETNQDIIVNVQSKEIDVFKEIIDSASIGVVGAVLVVNEETTDRT
ncbi:PREDICTED: uncharacterized protein C17orf104 homolog [Ceratosolen solmsi marchali]|uniref:Uncharacterized protein C17orf104 homolog n=1 Tax=Ceratosolen solmsi marchali TaxID=326594 RepID=A0AAJ7DT87_9HYME|nr:PREDICTED: uncharacterized protein C17orf104 homolog [Ceratosolen solmsi marchali]